MHHTKTKGDEGLTFVIHHLVKNDYIVSLPIQEHAPFDLIASKGNKSWRIQVKYRTVTKGTMQVHYGAPQRSYIYQPTNLDYFAVTNGEVVAFVPVEEDKTSVAIRIEPPKNNQKTNIRLLENYMKLI